MGEDVPVRRIRVQCTSADTALAGRAYLQDEGEVRDVTVEGDVVVIPHTTTSPRFIIAICDALVEGGYADDDHAAAGMNDALSALPGAR